MKRVWKLIAVISVMTIMYACVELEPTPQFKKSDEAFAATADFAAVAAAAEDSLDNVLTFTWNDPKYAIGLEQSKFTVKVGLDGGNFAKFLSKDFTGVLSGALLGKELNGMALRLGGTIGQPINLEVVIVASQANNNEPKTSSVMELTVTPYGDLGLSSSVTSATLEAVKASQNALTLTWTKAFNGFNGVKTYKLECAAGGTGYAAITTIDISGFSKSYSHFELNKLALANGVAALATGTVDFRIKATNELGAVAYSNTKTIQITTYVAYNTIGVIGSATTGSDATGWNNDIDMYRPDIAQPTKWRAILYLYGSNKVKFRTGDNWDVNWGAGAFPSGTATQGGSDIPVSASGYYQIDFNVGTGSYNFELLTTPSYSVGIIGSATTGSDATGWNSDIDMVQDSNDPHIWTKTITLFDGKIKLRADDDWAVNWGGIALPSGTATQGGGDISISQGTYFIWFNDVTKIIYIGSAGTQYPTVGIIGSATTGSDATGWNNDIDLIRDPLNPYLWSKTLTLFDGKTKFRANDAWDVNWGALGFPGGAGTPGGADIPTTAGTYHITFNSITGEYYFLQ